jgi:hypothetical protein
MFFGTSISPCCPKPGDRLRDMEVSLKLRDQNADVIRAIHAFEAGFEEFASTPDRNTEPRAQHQATADFSTLCG